MSNKVLFLDYDGVVNIAMWNAKGSRCTFNFPSHNKVNHFQAVQWVSEFCQKCGYDIVVTSTWRLDANYKECLENGGLRNTIKILGRTKDLWELSRGHEIASYLKDHPEIEYYIIVDDENDMLPEQQDHFVQTDSDRGFGRPEFEKCLRIFSNDREHGGSFS